MLYEVITFEDPRLLRRGDADPVVRDREAREPVRLAQVDLDGLAGTEP